jgi:hypothetical protein
MTDDGKKAPQDIDEAILEVVKGRRAEGATTDEIYRALNKVGTRVPIRDLRARLAELDKRQVLDTGTRASDGGRPSKIYLLPDFNPRLALFNSIRTREEVGHDLLPPEEYQRLVEEHGYLAEIAIDHFAQDKYVEAVRESVASLAEEDPVTLILDFAEWTVAHLRERRERARRAMDRGSRDEIDKHVQDFKFAAEAARNYFRDLFRLHRGIGDADRIFEIRVEQVLSLTLTDDQVIYFNRERAEAVLRERVVGAKVIEIERELRNFVAEADGDDLHVTSAATDASMIPVSVSTRPSGSYELPETLIIFTGAAAQVQSIAGAKARLVDHEFDLGFLRRRNEVQAAVQGWMITAAMQHVIGEGRAKYAISAAQELRQYRRDTDILLNRIAWRSVAGVPPERADVLVRDGRLFPLVHRLKDYESDGLYGQIVRNEIQEFTEACRRAIDEQEFLTYGAFVKQPVSYFLAPLVFWYCRVRCNRMDRIPERAIFRPPLGDTLLSYIMLREYLGSRPTEPYSFVTTFRVLRRYSDLATTEELPRLPTGPDSWRLVDEASEQDWAAYLRHRRETQRQRYDSRQEETPPIGERDYIPLRFLCNRVGILMGFALPADGRFISKLPYRLPRAEVLIDLAEDPQRRRDQFRRLLASFADKDSLVPDDDHPDGSKIQLIIPMACREAHRAAVFADDVYRRDFERKLTEAVGAVERAVRQQGTLRLE